MPDLSRRDFLKIASQCLLGLSGLLGLGMLVRFLGFQGESPQPVEFDLGPAADYPLDSRTLVSQPPALLVHTQDGFLALSLLCTHLGCTLMPDVDEFACPCHGSRFDIEGRVLHGPAEEALHTLRVEVNELGHVILFAQ